jgi:molecular chaperone DnaJ
VLKIPPGTQPGRKFRIKGLGLEKNGQKGDQLVQIQVTVPEKLTPEAEAKMKEFADTAGIKF